MIRQHDKRIRIAGLIAILRADLLYDRVFRRGERRVVLIDQTPDIRSAQVMTKSPDARARQPESIISVALHVEAGGGPERIDVGPDVDRHRSASAHLHDRRQLPAVKSAARQSQPAVVLWQFPDRAPGKTVPRDGGDSMPIVQVVVARDRRERRVLSKRVRAGELDAVREPFVHLHLERAVPR